MANNIEIGLDQELSVGGAVVECVRDVTVNREFNEADTTMRGAKVDTCKPTTMKISLEFELIDNGSAAISTLKAAFAAGTSVTLSCQDVSGSFYVLKMNRKEPLKDVVTYDCSAKPATGYGAT
jgi:hypothetical protein